MQQTDYLDGDTIITKRVVTVYPNCNNVLPTRFVIIVLPSCWSPFSITII